MPKSACAEQVLVSVSHIMRKPVFGVSDQVWHIPGCTTTEDGKRLETSDLGSKRDCFYAAKKRRWSAAWLLHLQEAGFLMTRFKWASLWDNRLFAYAKTKTQISFAVTAKLISTFVFGTQIVQSFYFLNPKFQASSHLLWVYSPVCIGPGQKPRRPVF